MGSFFSSNGIDAFFKSLVKSGEEVFLLWNFENSSTISEGLKILMSGLSTDWIELILRSDFDLKFANTKDVDRRPKAVAALIL